MTLGDGCFILVMKLEVKFCLYTWVLIMQHYHYLMIFTDPWARVSCNTIQLNDKWWWDLLGNRRAKNVDSQNIQGWLNYMNKQRLRFEVAQVEMATNNNFSSLTYVKVDLFNLNIATNIYSHWHKFSQTAFKESLILLDGLKRVFCFKQGEVIIAKHLICHVSAHGK